MKLHTLDISFDNFENLNISVEEVRKILDNFKQDDKIFGYYLMRYNNKKSSYLGIKILFNNSEEREDTITQVKEKIKSINSYKEISQDKFEEEIKNNLPLLCSISMEFRNKVWDLLGRKPDDNEFLYLTHYFANPLLLNYTDEEKIKTNESAPSSF